MSTQEVVSHVLQVAAHGAVGAVGITVMECIDDGGVLGVVAAPSFRSGGASFEAAPYREGACGVHDVEHVHKQAVVGGFGDGAVQFGVPPFETLEVVAGSAAVEAAADAVEVLGRLP